MVAAGLFMTPRQVRINLSRLNIIARELGYETFPPNKRGRMSLLDGKATRLHCQKVRRVKYKKNMTDEQKKCWHLAYSKIWHQAKREGLTVKQWQAAQLEKLKKRLALRK